MVSSALRWKKRPLITEAWKKFLCCIEQVTLTAEPHEDISLTVFFSISLCLHLYTLFKLNNSTGRTQKKKIIVIIFYRKKYILVTKHKNYK